MSKTRMMSDGNDGKCGEMLFHFDSFFPSSLNRLSDDEQELKESCRDRSSGHWKRFYFSSRAALTKHTMACRDEKDKKKADATSKCLNQVKDEVWTRMRRFGPILTESNPTPAPFDSR
jgi:hypothetical protein